MGGLSTTGNTIHDNNVRTAEGVRQVSVAAAGGSQSTVNAAEIVYWRARKASALANNLQAEAAGAQLELVALGTGGS